MKITERSLQEIGKSLLVSLPKEWTKLLKLKKGSKIKIRISEEKNLVISPEFTKREEKREGVFDYDRHFFRNFIREYFYGSEKITINIKESIKEQELKSIYETLNKFMNVQIIEDNSSKIVVKCFQIDDLSIEECLKRMQYISADMIDELLSKNNKTKMKELESSLTKFYFMLVMQIRRFLEEGKFIQKNQLSLLSALDFRMAGEKIERISDIIKAFRNVEDKSVKELLVYISGAYARAFSCFMSNDYAKSLELFEHKKNPDLNKLEIKAVKSGDIGLYQQAVSIGMILERIKEIALLTR
ncbi:hypothetical protein HYT26_00700 [Candidatus Pacearchaeota archaeon]|nr:hypothetical protein [Candidatus Pacearchaeota archaeon]